VPLRPRSDPRNNCMQVLYTAPMASANDPHAPGTRRTLAVARLRDAIVRGLLPAGSLLGEVETARRLGVSRTPVREALVELQGEGFVQARSGGGFRVVPWSVREVEEVYPLIGLLERHALEQGSHTPEELARLREIEGRYPASEADATERIRVDGELHEALAAGCPNGRLQRHLRILRAQALRYEWSYARAGTHERSRREHARVLELLEAGDRRAAGRTLEEHSTRSVALLVEHVARLERDPLTPGSAT